MQKDVGVQRSEEGERGGAGVADFQASCTGRPPEIGFEESKGAGGRGRRLPRVERQFDRPGFVGGLRAEPAGDVLTELRFNERNDRERDLPEDVGGIAAALADLHGRWAAGTLDGVALSGEDRERLGRGARVEELAELLRGLST